MLAHARRMLDPAILLPIAAISLGLALAARAGMLVSWCPGCRVRALLLR